GDSKDALTSVGQLTKVAARAICRKSNFLQRPYYHFTDGPVVVDHQHTRHYQEYSHGYTHPAAVISAEEATQKTAGVNR
ncbi:MAG: hypothetical protein WKF77_31180, partial [Planctomycetaceae bacterium]